jgi:hypothetical protein
MIVPRIRSQSWQCSIDFLDSLEFEAQTSLSALKIAAILPSRSSTVFENVGGVEFWSINIQPQGHPASLVVVTPRLRVCGTTLTCDSGRPAPSSKEAADREEAARKQRIINKESEEQYHEERASTVRTHHHKQGEIGGSGYIR